ncbi:MAG: heparinase II/III family protein [Parerythrobacter sp.]
MVDTIGPLASGDDRRAEQDGAAEPFEAPELDFERASRRPAVPLPEATGVEGDALVVGADTISRDVEPERVLERPETSNRSDVSRETLEPGRTLAIASFADPAHDPAERLLRLAFAMGLSSSTLAAPFRRPARTRLRTTVASPLAGERAAGIALRAGHFLIHGVKAPIAQMNFAPSAPLTPPFERTVHGFTWLRDLKTAAPREQGAPVAQRIAKEWMDANRAAPPRRIGGGGAPVWRVENVGHRLLNWLVHAPLLLTGASAKQGEAQLALMAETARWLDRNVREAVDCMGEVAGWCALVAAGLLLPEGRARRLYAEAGLARALGALIAEDGGVLSRSPVAQMDAIALLVDLCACYDACDTEPPATIGDVLALMVPPLLTLVHADGALGSWQGSPAVRNDRLAALIDASGVRARPLLDVRQWGYQRVSSKGSTLLFDAAPPPLSRHARSGCASTLAFEFCAGGQRLVVNCGGAAVAGGQVPARIEQGLRASAAHSTLVLDDVNSTAVMIAGRLGAGVGEVDMDRRVLETARGKATRVEASHDGYSGRYGLLHRRILVLRDDGSELRGEDLLLPSGGRGKRGKIAFAIRFHIGPDIELQLSEDGRGAGMALADGSYWQFRLASDRDNATLEAGGDDAVQGGESGARLDIEESMWVDGDGRPRPTQQLVIQGLTSRSGGRFSWLFKKMG